MADEFVPTTEQVRYAYATRMAPVRDGERYAEFDRWLAEIREQALAPIRTALDGHPVCDVHPDDDPVSCGWKRAVADVHAAVDRDGGVS